MKHFKLLFGIIACTFLLITSCKKEIANPGTLTKDELQNGTKLIANRSALSQEELKAKIKKMLDSKPAGFDNRLKGNSDLLLKQHQEYRTLVKMAASVTPTPCDGNTTLFQWLDKELSDWDAEVFYYAFGTAMLDLPFYDALLFENSSANQYFGVNGEYTQRLNKTFKDLKRFWDIQSNGIILAAMHGSMLRDRNKLIRTYTQVFGLPTADAEWYADFVLLLLDYFPQYRNGDHPIFTFNAFAVETFIYPPVGTIPDKIIMGDGIMHAYTAIGFDDVAPQAIIAHEFGHHIQFQLHLFGTVESPEATRRTELMADAYSAYFLSHARGASMQWKRVKQFLQVFFNIGDCAFNNNGHHGTPTQRMAAAEWAYNLANNAQKQGHILTSVEFTALFEAQLPELVTH